MRRSIYVVPLLLACCGTATLDVSFVHAATPVKSSKPSDPKLDYELLYAAAAGDTKGVERALARGANIEARDGQYGFTPLMWASWKANLGTMRRLIEKGANVNAKTFQANPTNVVLREPDERTMAGYMSFFVRNSGVTPLLLAGSSGSGMAVQELLKHGADVNAKTFSGESPLLAASDAGSASAVKALLAKGATPNETVTAGRLTANTPLFISIMRGHEDVVKELLHANVDVTGTLPVFGNYERLARHAGNPRIVALLAQARKQQLAKRAASQTSKTQQDKTAPVARNEVRIIHANGAVEVLR